MRAKTAAAFLIAFLFFPPLLYSAITPPQPFCPVAPVRAYLEIIAKPEAGELAGFVYTLDSSARKPVQGGLVYRVETKNPSGGSGSITACYLVTGGDGIATFSYDPAFSGCYSSWLIYCPNGATALSGSESGKLVRQMCLNGTGVEQSKIDGNGILPCASTTAPSDQQSNLLSHNEFSFCNYSPAGLQQLCWPLLLIFALLIGASFAAGKNPFAAFDLSAPRMSRGRQYSMRQQLRSHEYMSLMYATQSLAETMGKVRDLGRGKEVKPEKQGTGKFVKDEKSGKWVKDGSGKWVMVERFKDGKGPSNWGQYSPLGLLGKGVNAIIGRPLSKFLGTDMERLRQEQQQKKDQEAKDEEAKIKADVGKDLVRLSTTLEAARTAQAPLKRPKLSPKERGKRLAALSGKVREGMTLQVQSSRQNVQFMAGDLYYSLKFLFGPMERREQEVANLLGSGTAGENVAAIWENIKARFTISNIASVLIESAFRSGLGGRSGSYLFGTAYYIDRPEMLPVGLSFLAESIQMAKASVETKILMQKLLDSIENGTLNTEEYRDRMGRIGSGADEKLVFSGEGGTYIVVDPNTLESSCYRADSAGNWQKLDANGTWVNADHAALAALVGLRGTVEVAKLVEALDKSLGDKASYIQLDFENGKIKKLGKSEYTELLESKSDYEETLAQLVKKGIEAGLVEPEKILAGRFKDIQADHSTGKALTEEDKKTIKELAEYCKEIGLEKLSASIWGIGSKEGLERTIGVLLDRAGDEEYAQVRGTKNEGEYIDRLVSQGALTDQLEGAGRQDDLRLYDALSRQANARERLLDAVKRNDTDGISSAEFELQTAKSYVNAAYSLKTYDETQGSIQSMGSDLLGRSVEWRQDEIKRLTDGIEKEQENYNNATTEKGRQDAMMKMAEMKSELELYKTVDSYGDFLKTPGDYSAALRNSADFFQTRTELVSKSLPPEQWQVINSLNPADPNSTSLLRTIHRNSVELGEMEDWYSGSKSKQQEIARFKQVESDALANISDPVVRMRWEACIREIEDAQKQEITPEKKNEKGFDAMVDAGKSFGEWLKTYKGQQDTESYSSAYASGLEYEKRHLEEGINKGWWKGESLAVAKNTLSELEKVPDLKNAAPEVKNAFVEKVKEMGGEDPLSLAQRTREPLYYDSRPFKDQQLYEHQDMLKAPHYNVDVLELKEQIESGAMLSNSNAIKGSLRRLYEKDYIESLKRVREELQRIR